MKRYFIVPPGMLPHELPDHPHVGEYHYIDLDSIGPNGGGNRALVLMDERRDAHPSWQELPHLLDAAPLSASTDAQAKQAIASPDQANAPAQIAPIDTVTVLSDSGVADSDNMFQIAAKLAAIVPHFKP